MGLGALVGALSAKPFMSEMMRSARSSLLRLCLLLFAALFVSLGTFNVRVMAAETATVSWQEHPGWTVFAFVGGQRIDNGDTVEIGDTVQFDVIPEAGSTYFSGNPFGCNVTHQTLGTWVGVITEDCLLVIALERITFSTAPLAEAMEGQPYSQAIEVRGGYSPFRYVSESGDLPEGITLAEDGTLSGTPSEAGNFNFTVRATNEFGHSQTGNYTLTVAAAPEPTISWSTLPADLSTIAATADGAPLSSGDAVPSGSIVEFRVNPRDGQTYTEAPSGCGIQYMGSDATGDLWRTGPVTADCAVTFPIYWIVIQPSSSDELPEATLGQPYSVQFTTWRGYGPFTDWSWSISGRVPAGLSMDEETGELSGASQEAGTFAFNVTATNGAGHFYSEYLYELVVRADSADLAALTLSAGTLTPAFSTETTEYSLSVPYETETTTVTPTADDPGATIIVNGQSVTSGGTSPDIALATGDTTITIEVTAQNGTTKTYTVTVTREAPEITLEPTSLPNGKVGVVYGPVLIEASGGVEPYTYAVTAGTLPYGVPLSEDGSLSSGTRVSLDALGTHSFTITATDANGNTGSRAYSLTIDEPDLILSPSTLPGAQAGQAYSQSISVQNVDGSQNGVETNWVFELIAGALPDGMEMPSLATPSGWGKRLEGTPTEAGSFDFTLRATGQTVGFVVERNYTLLVDPPEITLGPDSLPQGATGTDYGPVPVTADGGTEPYSFAITAGVIPNGMVLADGSLSGRPTEAGSFTFTVTATDAHDFTGSREYTLAIDAPEITLGPDTLPDGAAGRVYDPVMFTAEGGTEPYAFSVTVGILPDGLTLAEDGRLSGTPTENGSFTFSVTATDANDFSGVREYTLAVDAPDIALGPDALPDGSAGLAYDPVSFTANGGSEPYAFSLMVGELPDGLGLAEDGTLSGTPVEAGSFTFTVTATDANDFIGTREYTLTVDAPEIVVTVPSLPQGNVNSEYGPVSLAASGGTEPYAFDLVSGELPEGITLAADGTLSGTPTEDGEFTITIRATDAYGFEGSASATLKVEALNLPVAQNHTLEVMAGTTGTLDLTHGATGGPFTGAAIAAYPASEAGQSRISRDDGAYILHFAAAGTFAGTASLTYTLSNADGTSEPATVTLTVIARPDPSLDPEVIGLIRAQTETAKRFANTQITNFNQRLEQLHSEGERRSNSIGVNVAVQQPADHANAYAPHEGRPHDPAVEAIGQGAPAGSNNAGSVPQPAPVENLFGDLAFWSGGFVNFGTNDNGAINLDHTLVGISAGVDYRFTPELTAGFGVGYGRDVTDIGTNGTESRAEAFSLAAYGSYRPVPGFFLDGLAGYSTMSFDSLRSVTATGGFATGSRNGNQLFASLSAGYEYRNDGLLISPYGRLSGSHSTLDAFTETGADMWNLTYGKQTIDTLSGTLGLRFQYAIPMEWGVLTPRGRLEYTHDFEGSSRASLGYADLGTQPYTLDVGGFSRDHLTIGLGLDAQIGESWNLGFDYRTAFGTNGDSQDHTLGVKLGVQF